jgi:hypothetical protein
MEFMKPSANVDAAVMAVCAGKEPSFEAKSIRGHR